jgi:two-component system, LytTR family, sensor kinase
MKRWKPTRIEWVTFLVLMPVVNVIINYLLFEQRLFNEINIWLFSVPLVHAIGFVSWYLQVATMHYLREKLPNLSQTGNRLLLLFISHMMLMLLTMWIYVYGFSIIDFLGYESTLQKFKLAMLLALFVSIVTTTLMEGDFIFKKWKESLAEKEIFEQLNLQQEFNHLKSQVNPHFLFNSFNTLSSLISEDPDQAEHFLNELSKVYRYLLRNNENELTTLQNELQFIRSYFRLLTYRYGSALQMKIEVDKKYEQYFLPSLSLQLLVENVVKHNIISKQCPLVIDIFTTAGNKLVVNNNLQLKVIKAPSNKVGLENIKTKYELLELKGFQVLSDDKNFTVVLPLMWSTSKETRFIKADFSTPN